MRFKREAAALFNAYALPISTAPPFDPALREFADVDPDRDQKGRSAFD